MTCPRCQRAVAPVDVFCGFCQAKIAATAPAAKGPASARGAVPPAPRTAAVATLEPTAAGPALEVEVAPPAVEPGGEARIGGHADLEAGSDRIAEARPAGFLQRAAAYLFDLALLLVWLVLALGIVAASRLVPLLAEGADPSALAMRPDELRALLPSALAIWLPIAALYGAAFVAIEGATPGKMILRLRVVRPDGGPVSAGRALVRGLAGGLCTSLTLGLAFLAVPFSAEKRALHDRLGGTLVIRLPWS